MEFWVRSQDKKTLSIAKNIKLDRYLGDKENVIISNDFFEIGKYKTEKRALEVLDEIHQRLIDLQTIKIEPGFASISKRCFDIVYEMPEK